MIGALGALRAMSARYILLISAVAGCGSDLSTVGTDGAVVTSEDASQTEAGILVKDSSPVVLATAQSPTCIAIDSTAVYWANGGTPSNSYTDGSVLKVPLGGGSVTTLAASQNSPGGIAVGATAVFWTAGTIATNGSVIKAPLAGGATVTLATAQNNPAGIALDSSGVYWADMGYGGGARLLGASRKYRVRVESRRPWRPGSMAPTP
jgi:hypothetical protein